MQLTTDGMAKYSYAAPLVPEMEAALKKQDKGDANNPKGMRQPSLAIHWSQDGTQVRPGARRQPQGSGTVDHPQPCQAAAAAADLSLRHAGRSE